MTTKYQILIIFARIVLRKNLQTINTKIKNIFFYFHLSKECLKIVSTTRVDVRYCLILAIWFLDITRGFKSSVAIVSTAAGHSTSICADEMRLLSQFGI